MSIRCPRCRGKTSCYDSRPNDLGEVIRKFTCRNCGCKLKTEERITHINDRAVQLTGMAPTPAGPITPDNAVSRRWLHTERGSDTP